MADDWSSPPALGARQEGSLVTELTRADIALYAGVSGDVNRVHVDEPFAQESGHPSVIAHGMLTMGLTGAFLTSIVGHERVRSFGGRFMAPALVGDGLACSLRVAAVRPAPAATEVDVVIETSKADGTVVFSGYAGIAFSGTTA